MDQKSALPIAESSTWQGQMESPDEIPEKKETFDLDAHLKKYDNLKSDIKEARHALKARTDLNASEKKKAVRQYLEHMLIDSIFPYWLKTTWDFNGHTDEPRNGEIACGYFVSTTLRDLGLKLNRYKVAQKASADIIAELCDQSSIVKFSSIDRLGQYLDQADDSEIFIVGLDYHVGFVFRRGPTNYFAHSNYIDRSGVMIESFDQSLSLASSNLYVVGNLSNAQKTFDNWMR